MIKGDKPLYWLYIYFAFIYCQKWLRGSGHGIADTKDWCKTKCSRLDVRKDGRSKVGESI